MCSVLVKYYPKVTSKYMKLSKVEKMAPKVYPVKCVKYPPVTKYKSSIAKLCAAIHRAFSFHFCMIKTGNRKGSGIL